MLSRMAESLYWIGRYVERAEQTARITDVTFAHTLAMGSTPEAEARRAAPLGDAARHRGRERGVRPSGACRRRGHGARARHVRGREPELDRQLHRPRAGQRAHAAPPGRDRDVGGAQPLPPRRAAPRPPPARHRRAGARRALLPLGGRVQPALPGRHGLARCRARRAGTSCRPASSWSGRRRRRARSTPTTACWSAARATGDRRALADAADDPQPWASVLRSLSAYESYYRVSSSGVQPRRRAGAAAALAGRPALGALRRGQGGRRARSTSPRTRRTTTARERASAARATPARRGARSAGCTRELAYQRFDDIVDSGLHAYLVDLQRQCYRIGEHVEAEFFSHRPLTAQEVMA